MTRSRSRIRGTNLAWGLLAVAAAAIAVPASAQLRITIPAERYREEEAGDRTRISLNTDANERDRLREMLLEWKQYVQEGNPADAGDVITQMKELLALDGVKDKQVLLSGLVAIGNEWAQTKSSDSEDLAERAYKAALELDPQFAPAHLGRAQLAKDREGGIGGVIGMAGGVVQALKARLVDVLGFTGFVANALFLLVAALAVTVCGIALVLLVKNNRLFRHAIQELLTDRVPEGVDRVVAWLLVFLPVVLLLSPEWWVLYWLVVLSGYGSAGLNRLAAVALLVLALWPPLFHLVTVVSSLQSDPVLRAAAALDRHDVSPENVSQIGAIASQANDATAWFLLAEIQAGARRPDEAIGSYGNVLSVRSTDPRAVVNRGNIHFRRSDLAQAIADYKLATDQDPDFALAWRNGSIAYAQNLQADVASEWLQKAQRLDRGAVQDWTSNAGPDRVVDAELSAGELMGLVSKTQQGIGGGVLRAFLNPLSIAAFLGFVFVLVRVRRGLGALDAGACEKCGRAFCQRCHPAAKSSAYCQQCVHLYVKKDGVSPVVRTAKLREVERHLAIRAFAIRAFNLLLPGAGSLYASKLFVGTLILLLWGAALTALLLPSHMVMDAGRLGHADIAVTFALELALLVVIYLVALMQSLRHST